MEINYKLVYLSLSHLILMYEKTGKKKYLDASNLYRMAIDYYEIDRTNTVMGLKFEDVIDLNSIGGEFYTPWND